MADMTDTLAGRIAAGSKVPEQYADAVEEMRGIIAAGFDELEKVRGQEFPATRFERDEDGNVVLGEDGTPNMVLLTDDDGNTVMEMHPLEHRETHHGLHAYRYEEQSDGSVVALYINSPDLAVKMKAFPNIETASLWSPREERASE